MKVRRNQSQRGIALKRVYKKYRIKHAISFHRSIRAADHFREQQDELNRMHGIGPKAEAISTRIWESVARANWQRFDDARLFVRSLGFKSETEWRAYCRSNKKPVDIPYAPQMVYANAGWTGWGDWLGTENIATYLRQYRSFKSARSVVHGLRLKSFGEWRDYVGSGKKPKNIPVAPNAVYSKRGWAGWGDWLGTGNVSNRSREYRSFEDACAFVRTLR